MAATTSENTGPDGEPRPATGEVVIVIPARYPSQRFPGKPLVPLKGATGEARTLLQRTHDVALAAGSADRVLVATDDERIAAHAKSFGAEVMMTAQSCRNGTERCAEVAQKLTDAGEAPGVIVNLQGDAPLTPPAVVMALIEAMAQLAREGVPARAQVATPVLRCDDETEARFVADRAAGRVGGTTAVISQHGKALYFSKEVLPYRPDKTSPSPVFHHIGVYAYTPATLAAYAAAPQGPLEVLEGLEQLRFLEQGVPITCVEITTDANEFWEVNNPVDVARVEAVLVARGIV